MKHYLLFNLGRIKIERFFYPSVYELKESLFENIRRVAREKSSQFIRIEHRGSVMLALIEAIV